jgi:PAS domain S-box-containing protein
MYSTSVPEDSSQHAAARNSGLEAVGAIPWGTHFCQFYAGKDDLLETLVPYIKAGLEANEFCLWITSEKVNARDAEDALRRAFPDLDRYLAEGRIEFAGGGQLYKDGGGFDANNALKLLLGKLDLALERGFAGMRAAGGGALSWLDYEAWRDFTAYESHLDSLAGSRRMLVLCSYPLDKCGPREIVDAAANHEFALIRSGDSWQVLENTARRRIEREFKKFVSLAANSSEFIGMCDLDFAPAYINEAGLRMIGLDNLGQLREASIRDLFFPEDLSFIHDEFLPRVFAEGRAEVEIRFRHFKTGKPLWMLCNIFFLRGDKGEPIGLATVSRDITARKRAEDAAKWNAQRNELLSGIAARLLRTCDPEAEVEELCRKVMAFTGCDVFFNFLVDEEEGGRLRLNAFAGVTEEQVRTIETVDFGATVCGTVARDRYRIIAEYISSSDSPLTAGVKSYGVEAYCCHPLMAQDRVIGTLSFGTRSRQRFASREIEVMAAVTDLVAMAINRIQTGRALRESERQLRQLGDSLPDSAVYRYGHEAGGSPRFYYLSAGVEQMNGVKIEDVLADAGTLHRQVLPEYLPRLMEAERRSARELSDFEMEVPMRRPDGEIRWMRLKARPQGMPDGRVIWDGVQTDITARKKMQDALRVSEERLRAIVGTALDGIIVIDVQGVIQSINPAAEQMFGYTSAETAGHSITMFMPEPYRLRHRLHVATSLRTSVPRFQQIEVEGLRRDGSAFPAELSVAPWEADGKRYFTGIIRDVTQRKRREEKINILLREVNHRSKNMLSLVQAIASQTAAKEPVEFVRHFSERIRALAASQDLLVKSQWQGISIEELVKSQLAHFRDLLGGRIELKGPPLRITASAAQSIGMALHELATNAGKYGALSNGSGRIAIGWSLNADRSGKLCFSLHWTESGGPAVSVPMRRGFGSIVVETMPRMELDAEAELHYAPEGLRWHLACPAETVMEAGDDPSSFRMLAQ